MSEQPLARAFEFCPRCGIAVKEPGQNPLVCRTSECDFMYFFSPITAVAGIVKDADQRVLFLRRAKDPGKGKLGLPGGFVDAGESLEAALVREILEETQLNARVTDYVGSFANKYVFQGVALPVTDMFFLAEVDSFDGLTAQEGEVTGFHMAVPTDAELNDMAFESNRRALKLHLSTL